MRECFIVMVALNLLLLVSMHEPPIAATRHEGLGLTEVEYKKLIDAADKKAMELGYKIGDMIFKIEKDGTLFVVDYSPKQHYEKRVITYGGGLTIWLDKKGAIIRFQQQI